MAINFIDPESVTQISAAWNRAGYDAPYRTEALPSAATLSPTADEWAYLLNLAFAASLRTDEARPTTFRLAFERDVDSPFSRLSILHEYYFSDSIDATAAELAKLAHATSGSESFIFVRRFRSDGRYAITGIGLGWARATPKDPDILASHPPAAVPIIQALGAGHIRVSKGDVPVAWINVDQLNIPRGENVLAPLLGERCAPTVEAIAAELVGSTALDPAQHEALRTHVRFRLVRAVERIIKSVIGRRHGGLLLIVPSTEHGILIQSLRAKYRCPYGHDSGIGASLRSLLQFDMLHHFPGLLEGRLSTASQEARTLLRQSLPDAVANCLLNYQIVADEIGAMSGVDGAIVLTQDLDLWGFGAEVLCKEASDEHCWPVHGTVAESAPESPVPYAHYGTRHRAAFRFCRNVPGALAIVVSQDGAAKLVLQHDGKVIYFDGLERDLL